MCCIYIYEKKITDTILCKHIQINGRNIIITYYIIGIY